MSSCFKRITGSLSDYSGQLVSLLGKFVKLEPNGRVFSMQSLSGDVITVQLQEPVRDTLEGHVEVLGVVTNDCTIQCQDVVKISSDMIGDFDANLYKEVVDLTLRLPAHYVIME